MADMMKLKKAEDEATKQVEAARKQRAATLKQARADADAEIKAYRDSQMKSLADLEKNQSDDNTVISELSSKADQDISTLKSDVQKNSDAIVKMMIDVVTDVNLDVPASRKGVKTKV
ncbi:V-type proton ATPase subunit G [Hondaea fermentalgiana]|uniref:V-type proton ATPase subunit G n=1 Tax=Hondaea fermentalgiana TaxID=2315210 RepID=A0A2R5GK25_9STRA|nr:V-type proton ATPase subunit G [Hondaea fermentalgiana]|eukprot:GBG28214.1 V-type proton ATPase subunit G [Hondaea fermentalgiana]